MKNTPPSVAAMPVIVAGTGNLAHHLPGMLQLAGHKPTYWMGRDKNALAALAEKWGAEVLDDVHPSDLTMPHLLFLAVSDTAIPVLAAPWVAAGHVVVHCSGSVASESVGDAGGVFYPMQTFYGSSSPDLSKIPFFVTTKNDALRSFLVETAQKISGKVTVIDDEQRRLLHLSAVLVNNFTNHLVLLAEQLLQVNGLDYRSLLPLMQETVAKLERMSPEQAQTGPAQRADHGVIAAHLQLLENYPEVRDVYTLLTNSILRKESEP